MIDMNKTYRTRDDWTVRLLCTDGPDPKYPVIGIVGGQIRRWTAEGESDTFGPLDLVEWGRWDEFQIDEPVLAQFHCGEEPFTAHFAGVSFGYPCVWVAGGTSWTTGDKLRVLEVRRP